MSTVVAEPTDPKRQRGCFRCTPSLALRASILAICDLAPAGRRHRPGWHATIVCQVLGLVTSLLMRGCSIPAQMEIWQAWKMFLKLWQLFQLGH